MNSLDFKAQKILPKFCKIWMEIFEKKIERVELDVLNPLDLQVNLIDLRKKFLRDQNLFPYREVSEGQTRRELIENQLKLTSVSTETFSFSFADWDVNNSNDFSLIKAGRLNFIITKFRFLTVRHILLIWNLSKVPLCSSSLCRKRDCWQIRGELIGNQF